MPNMAVDRTKELEEKLKALCVSSEDTCVFWEKRAHTSFHIRSCYYCSHYRARIADERAGICTYKKTEEALDRPQFKRIGQGYGT